VLGKPIVKPHVEKTTTVLTKLDVLFKQGEVPTKSRIAKIVRDTDAPRVVVLGHLGPTEDEEDALKPFHNVLVEHESDLHRGCAELGRLVEERMREHLERQLPELEKAVIAARDAKRTHEKELQVREPYEFMIDAQTTVGDELRKGRTAYVEFLAEVRDAISDKVKNAHVPVASCETSSQDIDSDSGSSARSASGSGSNGRYRSSPGKVVDMDKYAITRALTDIKMDKYTKNILKNHATIAAGNELTHSDLRACGVQLFGARDAIITKLRACMDASETRDAGQWSPAASYVKELLSKDLCNDVHKGAQPVIEHFAAKWALLYQAVLENACGILGKRVRKVIRDVFASTPQVTKRPMKQLEDRALLIADKLRNDAQQCIARLVRYNLAPLVYTTNEHYLTSSYDHIHNAEAREPPSDASSCEEIYDRWLAYRKVQSKVIIEAASKDLLGIYLIDFDAAMDTIMRSFTDPQIVAMVDAEPASRASERKRVCAELETLEALVKDFRGSANGLR
jgi:hypothetical protein